MNGIIVLMHDGQHFGWKFPNQMRYLKERKILDYMNDDVSFFLYFIDAKICFVKTLNRWNVTELWGDIQENKCI